MPRWCEFSNRRFRFGTNFMNMWMTSQWYKISQHLYVNFDSTPHFVATSSIAASVIWGVTGLVRAFVHNGWKLLWPSESESNRFLRLLPRSTFLDAVREGTGTRSAASIHRLAAPKLSSDTSTSTLRATRENRWDEKINFDSSWLGW